MPVTAHNKQSQQGAVLVITLVFMLILAMIGASALQSTILQERMAGNARDTNSALQAAEAALREAEQVLQGASVGPFNGTNGLFQQCSSGAQCTPPDWRDRASTGWVTVNGVGDEVSAAPQYYIEELPEIDNPRASLAADTPTTALLYYRVTARGFGVSDSSMVVLRTMYRRE